MQGDKSKSGMEVAVAERRCEVIDLAAWRQRNILQRVNLSHGQSTLAEAQRMGPREEAGAEVIAWQPRFDALRADRDSHARPSLALGRAARRLESAAAGKAVSGVEPIPGIEPIPGVESMRQIVDDMRRELDALEATVQSTLPPAAVPSTADSRAAAMSRWTQRCRLPDVPQR